MIKRIIRYAEVITICGGLLSTLWFGAVVPRFKRLIKHEIGFQMYLLMEIATEKQIEEATRKWKAYKGEVDP